MAKDSAVRIEIGRSFHQLGTVQEKVRESDLVPLWDGTTRCRSLAERKLLEGERSGIYPLSHSTTKTIRAHLLSLILFCFSESAISL